MTAIAKVSLNQWLLTFVGVAFGVWGGYQVLQYRVGRTERVVIGLERCIEEEKKTVWSRLDKDREERQSNKDGVLAIQYDIKNIREELSRQTVQQSSMQDDIKVILKKLP